MDRQDKHNAKGRQKDAAQPPGDRSGLVSSKGVKRTGEAAKRGGAYHGGSKIELER